MQTGENKTMVEMTDKEARDFLIFRQHQNEIEKLIDSDAFNPIVTQFTVFKTSFGVWATIETKRLKKY